MSSRFFFFFLCCAIALSVAHDTVCFLWIYGQFISCFFKSCVCLLCLGFLGPHSKCHAAQGLGPKWNLQISTIRPFDHTIPPCLACIQVSPTRALVFYISQELWEVPLRWKYPIYKNISCSHTHKHMSGGTCHRLKPCFPLHGGGNVLPSCQVWALHTLLIYFIFYVETY